MPFSRGSSQPGDQTQVSCIGRRTLYCLSHQGSPSKCRLNFISSCRGVFQRGCLLCSPTRKVPEIGGQSWEEAEASEPTPGVPVGQACMSLGRAPLTVSPGCLIAPHPHQHLVLSDILNIFLMHFNKGIVVHIMVLIFIFLVTNNSEHFFMYLSAIFDEVSTLIFYLFFIGVFFFLLTSFESFYV